MKFNDRLQDVGCITAENSSCEQFLKRLVLKEKKTVTGRTKGTEKFSLNKRDKCVGLCHRNFVVKKIASKK